jgi:histidyl-tRNA synthetase
MLKFRLAETIFTDTALKWGYQEIRTPLLEYLTLFTSAGKLTPGMLRQVYSFLDWDGWSGERVVLRPDGTIPIARYYVDNMKPQTTSRLFYIIDVFRFSDNQEDQRERWQLGAELIGGPATTADAELVTMAAESLELMGITPTVKISHSGLIQSILNRLEPDEELRHKLFDEILDGKDANLKALKQRRPEISAGLNLLLNVTGTSSDFLANVQALFHDEEAIRASIDDFKKSLQLLDSLNFSYEIDLASGKGFEYYTGMIFHLVVGDSIVGGGGRYDNLIAQMGGKAVPAAGFALYFNKIADLLDVDIYSLDEPDRFLVEFSDGEESTAFALAGALRDSGYTAELRLGDTDISAYDWVICYNDEGLLTLSDTETEEEFEFDTVDDLIDMLGGEASEE